MRHLTTFVLSLAFFIPSVAAIAPSAKAQETSQKAQEVKNVGFSPSQVVVKDMSKQLKRGFS